MGKQSHRTSLCLVKTLLYSECDRKPLGSLSTTKMGSVLFFLNRITCCSFSVLTKGKQSSEEVAVIMPVRVRWIGPRLWQARGREVIDSEALLNES